MKKRPRSTLGGRIAYNETQVECPACYATMIAKVADLKSDKLLRCPVCRTPLNDPHGPRGDHLLLMYYTKAR